MIGGGERAGIARALHHRQRVPDVGAPAGQRVKAEPALVGARRLGLGAGGLDQGGVQPDHQHRPWPATGRGGGSGQVRAGDRHRGQLPVPGHDRRPRRGPGRGGGPGQPPPGQPVAAQPLGQLVQRPQHRGVRRPTPGTEDLRLARSSPRCRTGSVAPAANAHVASTSARPRCRSGMNPARATTSARPVVRPSRSASNRGSTTPAWATVPAPPTSTGESLRPGQRGIADPWPGACSLHLKGVPSWGSCRSRQSAFSQVRGTFPRSDTPKTHDQTPAVNTRGVRHNSSDPDGYRR